MKRPKRLWLIPALTIFLIFLIFFYMWQNDTLVVTHYTYTNDTISSSFDDYIIVQLSDLHNKRFGRDQHRLISAVRELAPDIILLTGDIIDRYDRDMTHAQALIDGVTPLAPVYFSSGNHEQASDLFPAFYDYMADAGVILLEDAVAKIDGYDNDFIYIVGLSDAYIVGDTLFNLTSDLPDDELIILLAHRPAPFDYLYAQSPVDLVFSGHAHGGQLRLPFVGGLMSPDQGFFPPYTDGMHTSESVTMVVSRGLGNSILPLRLFNQPDIVCVRLVAAN